MKTAALLTRSALMLALATGAAQAADAPQQNHAEIQRTVARWLDNALAAVPGNASYSIGKVDSRLRLDACSSMEVSVPSGQRLVGNVLLRVRCTGGASWSLNVPAQISMQVTYFTATRPLAANQTIDAQDLAAQQGDLANLPGSVILDPAHAIGRTLNTAVPAGQPLRREMLRAAIVIQQNQRVRVVFRQDGMEIANEGTALANATEGSPVRVRVGNGSVISGIARASGEVEVGQ
ncbi:flagellar basal body P-ring formation chaperone FlgA [Chitinilyticum litopenaei]|uniref:flagellar basal body P-ring formation chaperone FlgA n=1 Tax=Chitinilyticum litopenaei TaxID=1121276 RepID=UPI000423D80C|nr:flagellar basal body P-ring formation chaperone FlgA [Chitinilyticum litopenaei]